MAIELKIINQSVRDLENDNGGLTELLTWLYHVGEEDSPFSEIVTAPNDETGRLGLKYGDDLYYRFCYANSTNTAAKFTNKLPNRYGQLRGVIENASSEGGSYHYIKHVVRCDTAGVMLMASSNGNAADRIFAVTSDNEGKPCIIDSTIGSNTAVYTTLQTSCRVAFARDANFVETCNNSFLDQYSHTRYKYGWQQVVGVPFVGYSTMDDSVYTPDAAWILRGPSPVTPASASPTFCSNMWQRLEFNGYFWLTNGYWMFRDEEVS